MLNGEFILSDKPCLKYNNRGLRWGDTFSVQLRGNSCFVYDFDKYFDCIKQMTEMLEMENNEFRPKTLANDIYLLLQKNRIYKEFAVTITIFRNSNDNNKLASDNSFSTLLSAESLPHEFYSINAKGLFTDILNIPQIATTSIPDFPVELLCGKLMSENNLDDLIITDEKGILKRSLYSNIFFTKGNSLIYASLHDNISPNKVFASRISYLANQKLGMDIYESTFDLQKLNDIDGMFLADPINGIRWVVGLGRKRFFKAKADEIAYEVYNYYKTEIERLKKSRS